MSRRRDGTVATAGEEEREGCSRLVAAELSASARSREQRRRRESERESRETGVAGVAQAPLVLAGRERESSSPDHTHRSSSYA